MTWLIARREIMERGRGKGFFFSTSLLLVAVIAGVVVANLLLGGGIDQRTIGVVAQQELPADGPTRTELVNFLSTGTPSLEVDIVEVAAVDAALEDGDVDVVFDGSSIVWKQIPDATLDNYVRERVSQAVVMSRTASEGLSPEELSSLFSPIEIGERLLNGDDEGQFGVRMVAALVSALGLFLLLQAWGGQIMLGVVEEKQSRVVEILLSKVKPHELLAGKVLGIGVLGLIQAAILVAGLAATLAFTSGIEVPDGVWSTVPLTGACFVFGYLFYGSAFAAVGATATRIDDVQSAQLPAFIPLFASYVVLASSIGNADGAVVTAASFIPFSAPLALPFRAAQSALPWPWVAVSLTLLAISSVVMIRVAAWVYQRSLLRMNSRVTGLELLREWRGHGSSSQELTPSLPS